MKKDQIFTLAELGTTIEQDQNESDNELKKQSYEKLVQQAKSQLIRTFLDREKRRHN